MRQFARRVFISSTALVCVLVVAGCGPSAAEEAAQTAYDACHKPEAENDLFVLDGKAVSLAVTGGNAAAMSKGSDAADALQSSGELDDDQISGVGIMMATLFGMECLVDETGYPGSTDELSDGEEWDGWTYNEEEGTGSEVTFTFTSTS